MIIKCNSCEKSFTVPDNAITASGRLVQCGSCGNKWTQYPQENINKTPSIKIEKKPIQKQNLPKKKVIKKKKKIKQIYSPEYLQKKHGIKIINPSDSPGISSDIAKKNKSINGLGFYSYLLILTVLSLTIFGTLNLTEELINENFPKVGEYVSHLIETLNNLKIIFFDIFYKY